MRALERKANIYEDRSKMEWTNKHLATLEHIRYGCDVIQIMGFRRKIAQTPIQIGNIV